MTLVKSETITIFEQFYKQKKRPFNAAFYFAFLDYFERNNQLRIETSTLIIARNSVILTRS